MKFLLDTNVLVAGLRSPNGASAALLKLVLAGKVQPLVSVPLFLEYEAVLLRPKHLLAAQLTEADVMNFLDVFAGFVEPTEIFYLWRPQLKDANDDMVLEAAVNGRADVIVTFNTADFLPAANKFNLKLMLPSLFLKELQHGH
jgi:putative PIN family toxin of toxin-antitoxin system